jgi:hypothetical protein
MLIGAHLVRKAVGGSSWGRLLCGFVQRLAFIHQVNDDLLYLRQFPDVHGPDRNDPCGRHGKPEVCCAADAFEAVSYSAACLAIGLFGCVVQLA